MSRKRAYSPEPWRVVPVQRDMFSIVDSSGLEIAQVWGDPNGNKLSDAQRANARLLGAAPELYGHGYLAADITRWAQIAKELTCRVQPEA